MREADLEESALIRSRYPLIFDACRVIADPVVRNLATVAGNLAHGDPANDHPAVMLALGAEVVAVGRGGERRIPVTAFFTGPFTTALRSDEIVTEIRVPVPPPKSGGAYEKLERKVGDFATAAVAAQLTLGADGACIRAGIGLTNVGDTPIKAERAEAALVGARVDEAAIRRAADLAPAGRPTRGGPARLGGVQDRPGAGSDRARAPPGGRAREPVAVEEITMLVQVTINGEAHQADVEPRLLLVHLLRDVLRLTGTHIGCDTSHCGACTVLLDGRAGQVVHAVRRAGQRAHAHDRRRARAERHAPSAAGRLRGRSTGCSAATARPAC